MTAVVISGERCKRLRHERGVGVRRPLHPTQRLAVITD